MVIFGAVYFDSNPFVITVQLSHLFEKSAEYVAGSVSFV